MPAPPPNAGRHRGPCPVQEAVGVLGGKWAVPVVGRLANGEARFGRLRAQVVGPGGAAVSSKALSAELRRLAAAEIVERVTEGAAVTYRLTDRGRALVPVLDALGEWAADAGPPSGALPPIP